MRRLPGNGWLVLLGGGEFSFGETLAADRAWLEEAPPGPIGFLPTASGSDDYGRHFATYLGESFQREVETVPIYRARDARRAKNLARIDRCGTIYIGGGIADELLAVLGESPALERIAAKLGAGGMVVAIAAAAQAVGRVARSLSGGASTTGFGWLPGGVVEPNFDPGHDRRLRQLMENPGVDCGLGLASGSALMLGPEERAELVGSGFLLHDPDGDLEIAQLEYGVSPPSPDHELQP
jgi:cyanophycinase-like exopeptidase